MDLTVDPVGTLVRAQILAFPELFQSRFDVLEHVLCVLGNGYAWRNGAPHYDHEPWQPWTAELTWRKAFENFPELPEIALQLAQREINSCQPIVDSVDERIHSMVMRAEGMVYQQTPHALLMNVPIDVHPAWAAAVIQVREIVADHGWQF